MMKKISKLLLTFGLSVLAATAARAEIDILITQGIDDARPVAVVPFEFVSNGVTAAPPHDLAEIIANDLRRSGLFRPLAIKDMPAQPHSLDQVSLDRWRSLGIEALVIGKVEEVQTGQYRVTYDLLDVFRAGAPNVNPRVATSGPAVGPANHLLLSREGIANNSNYRRYGHRIADAIYEKLTGERGAFDTWIAYVNVDRTLSKPFQLYIADSDGYNPQRILASNQSIMSPNWSPDGKKLAYVSFENGRSEIFIHDIGARSREKVASFKGINSSPVWSPDGQRMAMVLSKDGNAEIYVMDLASRKVTRLTNHWAIDTEPAWAPDGRSLVFTSDRGGKPQIYRVNLSGSLPERVTFEGRYNAGAEFTPDGKRLVLVQQVGGVYRIAVLDLATGSSQVLTETQLDESPTLAPNGSMIIYATAVRGRQLLSAVSLDGRFKARLPSNQGEVKAPAWSPFLD